MRTLPKAFTASLGAINHKRKRDQDRQRASAWANIALACRAGWSPDWAGLLKSDDSDLRARVIKALPIFPEMFAKHAATIAKELGNADASIVSAAAQALIKAKAPQAGEAIQLLIKNAHGLDWRERAALVGDFATLGKGFEDVMVPALKNFAQDTDFFVRKAAEGALYMLQQH